MAFSRILRLLFVLVVCASLVQESHSWGWAKKAVKTVRKGVSKVVNKAKEWFKDKLGNIHDKLKSAWEKVNNFARSAVLIGKRLTNKFINFVKNDMIPWIRDNKAVLIKAGISIALFTAAVACGACAIATPLLYLRAATFIGNSLHTGITMCKDDSKCRGYFNSYNKAKKEEINFDAEEFHTDAAVAMSMAYGDTEYLATPRAQADQARAESMDYTDAARAIALDLEPQEGVPMIDLPIEAYPIDADPMKYNQPELQAPYDFTESALLVGVFLTGIFAAVVCALLIGKRQQNKQLRSLLKGGSATYQPVSQQFSS